MAIWYEKLAEYFPVEEMKSKQHMELLLKEKGDIYHKEESDNHVMMYVETDDFIFVDYLFVAKQARGEGLGKKLLERLKKSKNRLYLKWSLSIIETRIRKSDSAFIVVKGLNMPNQLAIVVVLLRQIK